MQTWQKQIQSSIQSLNRKKNLGQNNIPHKFMLIWFWILISLAKSETSEWRRRSKADRIFFTLQHFYDISHSHVSVFSLNCTSFKIYSSFLRYFCLSYGGSVSLAEGNSICFSFFYGRERNGNWRFIEWSLILCQVSWTVCKINFF